jgi:hypothetical protein
MTPEHKEAGEIARGLTKAQREVLLRGLHGRHTITTLISLHRRGLVRRLSAAATENAWPRTPLGEQVAAIIQNEAQHDR